MTYSEFIDELQANAEPSYAAFHARLTPTNYKIMGVRVPTMRKIAKKLQGDLETLFAFPNEYYEVVFIKLTIVSLLPYERFVEYVEPCVALMDNWAHCDSFKAKCIRKNKEKFLPVLEKIFQNGDEFSQRYVLVTLLSEYVEKKYLPLIEDYIRRADTVPYYVHMAVAWLLAEILIKEYDDGVKLLKKGVTSPKTHDKAIQKAIESYRLTNEQKEFLRSLKIKNIK